MSSEHFESPSIASLRVVQQYIEKTQQRLKNSRHTNSWIRNTNHLRQFSDVDVYYVGHYLSNGLRDMATAMETLFITLERASYDDLDAYLVKAESLAYDLHNFTKDVSKIIDMHLKELDEETNGNLHRKT